MVVKAKSGTAKVVHESKAKFKMTTQGNSVRSRAQPGRKKRRGQGR